MHLGSNIRRKNEIKVGKMELMPSRATKEKQDLTKNTLLYGARPAGQGSLMTHCSKLSTTSSGETASDDEIMMLAAARGRPRDQQRLRLVSSSRNFGPAV